jgi:hypothetical protein
MERPSFIEDNVKRGWYKDMVSHALLTGLNKVKNGEVDSLLSSMLISARIEESSTYRGMCKKAQEDTLKELRHAALSFLGNMERQANHVFGPDSPLHSNAVEFSGAWKVYKLAELKGKKALRKEKKRASSGQSIPSDCVGGGGGSSDHEAQVSAIITH